MREKKLTFLTVLFLLACICVVPAQRVDQSYNASAEADSPINSISGTNNVLLPLADGKLLAILTIGSRVLMRISANGDHDPAFNCSACNFTMGSIAVQPDGKYLVAGNSGNSPHIIRLNTNGGIDASFSSPFASEQGTARVYAVTPAGQIYVSSSAAGGILRRLNSDGSLDNSFTPRTLGAGSTVINIMVQPDGKVLVAGSQLSGGILFRLNVDGTTDTGWTAPVLSDGTFPPQFPAAFLTDVLLQADGKVVITGQFGKVNGVSRRNIARLNPDSTVDGASASGLQWGDSPYSRIMLQSDGKLILYIDTQGSGSGFRRLNTDLTIDTSFSMYSISLINDGMTMAVNSNDQVTYVFGSILRRLNLDGTFDDSVTFRYRIPAQVNSLALQPDGKAVIAGNFRFLSGFAQRSVGRLNPDGTLDTSLVTGTGFNNAPSKIAVQPDGKLVLFGNYTSYNGSPVNGLVRLNSDGSLDGSFAPSLSGVTSFAVQPDGKIVLFGGNITVNGTPRPGLARLNSDGSLDTPFNPVMPSPTIRSVVVHPDGKITIAGTFASVNGVNRSNLARLNADGSVDTTLDAGNLGPLDKIGLFPNGQYIITRAEGTAVYRANPDGMIDPSFVSGGFQASGIRTMLPEIGGSVILGGSFTSPRVGIIRLRSSGAPDNAFLPAAAIGNVLGLARQADGKVLAVGFFSGIGGFPRTSIARIINARADFDFDGDGRADPSVTRPSDFVWHQLSTASGYTYTATTFGQPGDVVTPGDYDGDGRSDLAVWRPSTGDWWWRSSSTGVVSTRHLGDNGDTPLPSDIDGDGKTNLVVVTSTGGWKGMNAEGVLVLSYQFSQTGDKPVTGDFDGDGKDDLAYFRPSEGKWYYNRSSSGLQTISIHWGIAGDVPVPGDYDDDGKTDVAVFRPSEGNWYVSKSGSNDYIFLHFGATGDKPIPADYDGDGKTDIAVYRPSEGFWYELLSTGGYTGYPWGNSTDIPTPNALVP